MNDIALPKAFNPEKVAIKNQQATSLSNLFDPIANPLSAPSAAPNSRTKTRSTTMQVYAKTIVGPDLEDEKHH